MTSAAGVHVIFTTGRLFSIHQAAKARIAKANQDKYASRSTRSSGHSHSRRTVEETARLYKFSAADVFCRVRDGTRIASRIPCKNFLSAGAIVAKAPRNLTRSCSTKKYGQRRIRPFIAFNSPDSGSQYRWSKSRPL